MKHTKFAVLASLLVLAGASASAAAGFSLTRDDSHGASLVLSGYHDDNSWAGRGDRDDDDRNDDRYDDGRSDDRYDDDRSSDHDDDDRTRGGDD